MRKPREPKLRNTNLLKRFDKINLEFFGGLLCGGVGWRNFPLGGLVSQAICLFDERFIKVNAVLDDVRVPIWYLDFVLYHEMLHLQHGPQQYSADSYAFPHSLRFQCMEASHPNYQKALDFEAKKFPQIVDNWKKWREWERSSKKKSPLRAAAKRK